LPKDKFNPWKFGSSSVLEILDDLSFKFPFLATCVIRTEDLGSSVSMLVSMIGMGGPRLLVLELGIILERTNT
jgi:hypothetical protein